MNVDEMLTGARDAMTVKRVYGDPIERDGVLVIPAAKVTGGGGGGGDSENNAGGGFGVSAKPAGAWIIRNGEVEWTPAIDATRIASLCDAGRDRLPVDRALDRQGQRAGPRKGRQALMTELIAGLTREHVDRLREQLDDEVITPGDDGYDDARRVWNAIFDRRPAILVRPTGRERRGRDPVRRATAASRSRSAAEVTAPRGTRPRTAGWSSTSRGCAE